MRAGGRATTSAFVVAGLLGIAGPAWAEEEGETKPTETPARAPDVPPDVVVLKAGGMIRGTISEMDPQGQVVIHTTTGKTRHIEMSEVEFAGPAEKMPKRAAKPSAAEQRSAQPARPTPSNPAADPKQVPVTLRANLSEVTFHLKTGSGTFEASSWSGGGAWGAGAISGSTTSYRVLCTAPCETTLPGGTYQLGLSQGDGKTIEAEAFVAIDGPTQLEGTYSSNGAIRATGWIVGVGGVIGGFVMMGAGFPSGDPEDEDQGDDGLMYGGMGLVLGSFIAAWIMIGVDDDAEIQAVPKYDAAARPRRQAGIRWTPSGLVF